MTTIILLSFNNAVLWGYHARGTFESDEYRIWKKNVDVKFS